jgi:hypothetical protein
MPDKISLISLFFSFLSIIISAICLAILWYRCNNNGDRRGSINAHPIHDNGHEIGTNGQTGSLLLTDQRGSDSEDDNKVTVIPHGTNATNDINQSTMEMMDEDTRTLYSLPLLRNAPSAADILSMIDNRLTELRMDQMEQLIATHCNQMQQSLMVTMNGIESRILEQAYRIVNQVVTERMMNHEMEKNVFSRGVEQNPFDSNYELSNIVGQLQLQFTGLKEQLQDMGNEYSKALQELKEMIDEIRKQISSLKCTVSEQSKSIEIVQNLLKEQQKLMECQEKLSQSVNLLEIRMRDQENVITEQLSKQSFVATPKQTISQDDILHTLQNTSTRNIQETEVQHYPSESYSSPEQLFALEELSTSSSDNENEKKEGHSDSSMKLLLDEDYFQNQ